MTNQTRNPALEEIEIAVDCIKRFIPDDRQQYLQTLVRIALHPSPMPSEIAAAIEYFRALNPSAFEPDPKHDHMRNLRCLIDTAKASTAMAAENEALREEQGLADLAADSYNRDLMRLTAENAGLREALKYVQGWLEKCQRDQSQISAHRAVKQWVDQALAAHGEGKL